MRDIGAHQPHGHGMQTERERGHAAPPGPDHNQGGVLQVDGRLLRTSWSHSLV